MLIPRERSRDPLWIRTSPKDRNSHTLSGLPLALNTALLLTVAVELVDAQEGLGAVIWFAWDAFQTDELYAALAITAILGIGSNYLLQRLACHLVPWQTERG
jgi:NitT/TauT family transport system permease protein